MSMLSRCTDCQAEFSAESFADKRCHACNAMRLEAELRFVRADNVRLVAENKKLGEQIETGSAARQALNDEVQRLHALASPMVKPLWNGKCSICLSPLDGPMAKCRVCERTRTAQQELLDSANKRMVTHCPLCRATWYGAQTHICGPVLA